MADLPISHVKPDYQHLYNELAAKLQNKGTWIDLLPTSVGTTITDMVAGATTSNQLYIEMSLRESFLPSAVRDSSIFSGTRWMGVKLSRKTPAGVAVSITNNYAETKFIPPYSAFTVGGRNFFNRVQLVITPNETLSNVELFQGLVKSTSFDLDEFPDLTLTEFFLSEPGFVVSDQDVLVYTTNKTSGTTQVWSPTDNAIFEHSEDDYVYYNSTTGNGDVSLFFGDGEYGKALSQGTTLNVRYVVTNGSVENKGMPGLATILADFPDVKGVSTTSVTGASDQKSSLYYKLFASSMFRTKKRVISGADYRGRTMDYPGVADVTILGQRDIAPNDNSWMNVMRICILPENADTWGGANPNPKSATWTQYLEWLRPKQHDLMVVQTWNPTKIFVNVRLKLAILPHMDPGETRILALEKVLKLFQKKPGTLGRRLSLSDLQNAAKIEGVDYVEVLNPTEEIKPRDKLSYVVLDGTPVIDVVYSERTLGSKGAF